MPCSTYTRRTIPPTWRDFFIHIATIVVGLLIAVGLEQTVERVHGRYKLRECESNRAHLQQDERHWLLTAALLRNHLMVLRFVQQHPGMPQTALRGDLDLFHQAPFAWDHAVWDAAQQNGVVRLMPLEEANASQAIYELAADEQRISMRPPEVSFR